MLWPGVNVDMVEFKFDNFSLYLQQAGYDNKLLAIESLVVEWLVSLFGILTFMALMIQHWLEWDDS